MTNVDEQTDNDLDVEEPIKQYNILQLEFENAETLVKKHLLSHGQVEYKFQAAFPRLAAARKRAGNHNKLVYQTLGPISFFKGLLEILPEPKIKKQGGSLWLESDIDDFIAGLKALAPNDGGEQ